MNITLTILATAAAMLAGPERADTLEQSVITGTRIEMQKDRLPAPISIVGRQTIEHGDQNVLMPTLMEQVPGLFVTSRGVTGYGVSGGAAGAISLRGFSAGSGRVLILIDGHPQYEAIYGHPVADEYTTAAAERVEVTRGAASVLYGSNAMGGAINIITRKPSADGNHLSAKLMGGSYGTARITLTDSYSNGRFWTIASASHDRTDGHRPNAAFRSTSGMLKTGYQLSNNWQIQGNANLVRAYSENPGTEAQPMLDGTADITRLISALSLENTYERARGAVNLYYNWGYHKINDGYRAGGTPQPYLFHGTDYQGGANIFEALGLFEGNTLTAGLDAKIYGGNAYRNPVTEIYADHIRLHEEAAYVLDQHSAGRFLVEAGLRLEHNSLYGTQWVPQAGLAYTPDALTSIKLSASKGFRSPNLRELYMYAVANEDLVPEEAWSYDLTLARHFLDGRLNVEASLFYTKGSNLIDVVAVDGRRQNHNVGAFENRGAELSLDYAATPALRFNANYSYLGMSTIYTGAPVHKAYAGCRWTPGRFSLDLGAMAVKDLYLSTGDDAVTSSYVDVHARASYRISSWAEIFARGENLLNSRYATMLGFPEPGITLFGGLSITL